MKSAPCFRFVRTALRISSGPSARFLTIGTSTIDRKLPRVARAAGRRDVVAGRHQPRTGHDALVDRLPQIDVGVRPGRPHVAAGREAGHQRDQRVLRAVQRRLPRRRLQQLVLPVDAGAREMRVQIDQARQQRGASEIDDARAGGNPCTPLPTASMRSPRMTTTAGATGAPPRPSMSRAARTAISRWRRRLTAEDRGRRGDGEELLHDARIL